MLINYDTTTAKELQKSYRKIFDRVKDSGNPVYVLSKNKLDVVIVSADYLNNLKSQFEQETADTNEALDVYKNEKYNGTLKTLKTPSDLLS